MLKISLIFALLIGVLTVGQARDSKTPDCTATIPKPGQYEDPNFFYLCVDPSTPLLVPCQPAEKTGFLDNTDVFGCVPWNEWKCLDTKLHSDCSDPANAGKKIMYEDPNNYLDCPATPSSTPVTPTKCDDGQGFDPDESKCVEWKEWKLCD